MGGGTPLQGKGGDRPQDEATCPNSPARCFPLISRERREAQASASVRSYASEYAELATPNILWLVRGESPSNCVFFACHSYTPAVLTFLGPRCGLSCIYNRSSCSASNRSPTKRFLIFTKALLLLLARTVAESRTCSMPFAGFLASNLQNLYAAMRWRM